MLARKSIK